MKPCRSLKSYLHKQGGKEHACGLSDPLFIPTTLPKTSLHMYCGQLICSSKKWLYNKSATLSTLQIEIVKCQWFRYGV